MMQYKIRGDGNATALFEFMSRYITKAIQTIYHYKAFPYL